MTGDKQVKILK